MPALFRWFVAVLFAITVFSGVPAGAAGHAEHASHDAPGEGLPQLKLNQGRKWPTDEVVRQGMSAIRTALDENEAAPGRSNKLAEVVATQVSFITGNCRLDKQTDAMFHVVLADLMAGEEALKGRNTRLQGIEKVKRALGNYGKYFNHPGWGKL